MGLRDLGQDIVTGRLPARSSSVGELRHQTVHTIVEQLRIHGLHDHTRRAAPGDSPHGSQKSWALARPRGVPARALVRRQTTGGLAPSPQSPAIEGVDGGFAPPHPTAGLTSVQTFELPQPQHPTMLRREGLVGIHQAALLIGNQNPRGGPGARSEKAAVSKPRGAPVGPGQGLDTAGPFLGPHLAQHVHDAVSCDVGKQASETGLALLVRGQARRCSPRAQQCLLHEILDVHPGTNGRPRQVQVQQAKPVALGYETLPGVT